MPRVVGRACFAVALIQAAFLWVPVAQGGPPPDEVPPPVIGRWDVTVQDADGPYPSWFEFRQSGHHTLVGRYVARSGSARPISRVEFADGSFRFVVPPQWEKRETDIVFEGRVDGEVLRGQTVDAAGARVQWEARRAPSLNREQWNPRGEPMELFNGRDLTGWKPRKPGTKSGWRVQDGVLVNAEPGSDLVTDRQFVDFGLHAEFRYPSGSNSGIYLRGPYEVQIEDNFGEDPDSERIGGVYGFLTPNVNAARRAGEWQTLEVTLSGRLVTIVLNGERIIERQNIPGITGGALDSNEGQPGPIMIQGDHGRVEFRSLRITPIAENPKPSGQTP